MSTDTTFAQLLYPLGHGCALFDPDPCGQYDRVRPGDVGFIRLGKFHMAFNVLFPETDLINKRGVPEGFKHLNIEEEHIDKSAPLPPGVLHSKSVKVHGLSLDASVNAIKDGISVDLSCSKQRGAALLTKFPAYREDTLRLLDMKECFITHYKEWLEFLNGKLRRDITLSEMILVTGCTMTADWATTVFSETTTEATVSFQVGYAPVGSVQFSLKAQNENHLSSSHLIGPTSRYGNKELVSFDSRSDDIVIEGRNFDQCVFLRGYRLKEQRGFKGRKVRVEDLRLKAAAGPHNLPYWNDDDDSCQANVALTTDLVSLSGGSSDESDSSKGKAISHNSFYNVVLDYILENSNVDIAVVHDNDFPLLFSAKEDVQDFHIEKGDLMITNDNNLGIDIGSIGAKAQSRPIENARTSERDRNNSSADEVQMEFNRGSTNNGGVDYMLVDALVDAPVSGLLKENIMQDDHNNSSLSLPADLIAPLLNVNAPSSGSDRVDPRSISIGSNYSVTLSSQGPSTPPQIHNVELFGGEMEFQSFENPLNEENWETAFQQDYVDHTSVETNKSPQTYGDSPKVVISTLGNDPVGYRPESLNPFLYDRDGNDYDRDDNDYDQS